MPHRDSETHKINLQAGLQVALERSFKHGGCRCSIVTYSDGSNLLFTRRMAQEINLLGAHQGCQVFTTGDGGIIVVGTELESYWSTKMWLDSMMDDERKYAEAFLEAAGKTKG